MERCKSNAAPSSSAVDQFGTPALIQPDAGVVLALASGTSYVIRVPAASIPAALQAGCAIERTWTGGGKTNIEAELGRGWVFGCWAESEKRWLAAVYAIWAVA